jgi:hypothetical protein
MESLIKGEWLNDELETMRKEANCEKTHKTSVRIAGIRAEI